MHFRLTFAGVERRVYVVKEVGECRDEIQGGEERERDQIAVVPATCQEAGVDTHEVC